VLLVAHHAHRIPRRAARQRPHQAGLPRSLGSLQGDPRPVRNLFI
jgi:hypothetical protein